MHAERPLVPHVVWPLGVTHHARTTLPIYKVALALSCGLVPIFICCLMFKATEQLFWRCLNYGLGTLFSLAVLSLMTSIVLALTLRVAGALWASSQGQPVGNFPAPSAQAERRSDRGTDGSIKLPGQNPPLPPTSDSIKAYQGAKA